MDHRFIAALLFIALTVVIWLVSLSNLKQGAEEARKEPLGLPRGSVRALVTIMVFVGAFLYLFLVHEGNEKTPEFLVTITSAVLGYYFGARTGKEKPDQHNCQEKGKSTGSGPNS